MPLVPMARLWTARYAKASPPRPTWSVPKGDVSAVKNELLLAMSQLETKKSHLETRLTVRVGGMLVAGVAVL